DEDLHAVVAEGLQHGRSGAVPVRAAVRSHADQRFHWSTGEPGGSVVRVARGVADGTRVVRFGVLQFFSWPGRRFPLPEVYRRAFDRIDVMERAGYDAVWLAEHHFSTYSVCPSIHMMGAHIAARTERLRIGTAVSLAPFYHPLRLAEEVALLDVLSNGRVNFGAGRGFDATEYRNFGVAPEGIYPKF